MKTMNLIKKVTACALAVAVIITGMVIAPKEVRAASEGADVSETVDYVSMTMTKENDKFVTPTKDGYLFGGWYSDNAGKQPITEKTEGTTAYAKFVPSHVLSIKAQNYDGTSWSDSTNKAAATDSAKTKTTTTRLVTAVDCIDYQKVGFVVTRPSDGKTATVEVHKVYVNLGVKSGSNVDKYTADLIFGEPATHFAVLEYKNIQEITWDENIYVKPYWITADGTTVTGLPKYVRVDDGIDGFISVAVNLKTAEAIAAGVVNVSYESSVLSFDSFSEGKVFEEMEVADKGTSVKCVGNLETITDTQYADDMYISLRFEVKKDENGDPLYNVMEEGGLTFYMDQIDFAANDETLTDTNVWDVLY